jgi:hypothetical protein
MKLRLGVAATVAVLAVALPPLVTACGGNNGGNGGANSAADRDREARDAALRYAQCMREHGVDVPDPSFEAGGRVNPTSPDEDVPPATLREAEQACRQHDPEANPPTLSEEEQREFREAALANARCMREHGIENFPDPTFDENGAHIPEGGAIDPDDPGFQEAQEACQDTQQRPSEETAP